MTSILMSPMLVLVSFWWQTAPPPQPAPCRPAGPLVRVEALPEASGVAASRRTPGIYWAHNDSSDAVIVALDERGVVKGRVRITGAQVDDWEDVAVGRCAAGWCLYIADIGDNNGERGFVTVYRVPEPQPGDRATAEAEAFHAAYPDGPRDAESLFVTGDSGIFIVTKGDPGSVALYRFPRELDSSRKAQLQRVGEPLASGKVDAKDRPTAADVSHDGAWIAVRTTRYVMLFRTEELVAGRWREPLRVDVTPLDEPRGEGVTFTAGGNLVLVGEAGGPLARRSGTFARLDCTLPR